MSQPIEIFKTDMVTRLLAMPGVDSANPDVIAGMEAMADAIAPAVDTHIKSHNVTIDGETGNVK